MNGLNMGRQRILRIKAEQKVMKMCLSIGQMVAEAQGGTLEDEGAGSDEDSSVDWPNAEDTAEEMPKILLKMGRGLILGLTPETMA